MRTIRSKLAKLMLQEEQHDEALASEVSRYETCMAAAGVSHRVLSDVGAATRQMNASDKARHKKCSPGVSGALDKAHQRAVDKFERKQKQAILRAIRSALREAR